jgi:hypothetical protein
MMNDHFLLGRLSRARGCLPRFYAAQPVAQHRKSTLGEAKDSWHNPNRQRQENKYQRQHQPWMIEDYPNAAQNCDVLNEAGDPVAKWLRAGVNR